MVLVNDVRQVSRSLGRVSLVGDDGKLVADSLPTGSRFIQCIVVSTVNKFSPNLAPFLAIFQFLNPPSGFEIVESSTVLPYHIFI